MNAVKKPNPQYSPPESTVASRAVYPRPKRYLRQRSYQIMALEITMKIGVNVAISAVAISALSHMLPYNWSQQEKLRAISTQISLVESRLNKLVPDFQQNFDPRQARDNMQKYGYRVDPSQRPVVITNSGSMDGDNPASNP